jgi:hypothetical protein
MSYVRSDFQEVRLALSLATTCSQLL